MNQGQEVSGGHDQEVLGGPEVLVDQEALEGQEALEVQGGPGYL